MTNPCTTCKHAKMVFSSSWGGEKMRCMRPARFRSGEHDNHPGLGRSIEFERDGLPEPHRWLGDKCDRVGRNWEAIDAA